MGLIRSARPTANSPTGTNTWSIPGGATDFYAQIDDPIGTYVVRGTGGGVTTTLADEATTLVRSLAPGGHRATFQFAPIVGDDDLMFIRLHVRARLTTPGSDILTLFHRHLATNDADVVNPFTITSTDWTDFSADQPNDPFSGASWTEAADELADGAEFGFYTGVTSNTIQVTRFYIEAHYAVGQTLGRHMRQESWRWCDVCGLKALYATMQRPTPPSTQAGLVVCPCCVDALDHDARKIASGRVPRDTPETLY